MKVDYGQLSLAQQLLERQDQVHAKGMYDYVKAECELTPGDMGQLLLALYPLTVLSVVAGQQVFRATGALARASADAVDATIKEYVAADEAAHDAFNRLMVQLGGSATPYADPRSNLPTLGPAQSSADPGYGSPEGNIFQQAAEEGSETGAFVRDSFGRVVGRVSGWTASGPGVVERNDPSSYLVKPQAGNSEMENLRWSAGPLLGGVDWIFEQLFHFSLLEDVIMKPITGNWEAIDESSIGWGHLGRAAFEMGENFTGLPEQTGTWEGEAADMFRAAIAAMGAALVGLSVACDYVSGLMEKVSMVAQLGATAILSSLGIITTLLLSAMAEGAIPVVGWIAAAATVAVIISRIVTLVKAIYTIVNMIMDAIYDFIESKEKLVEVAFVVEDLVEYFSKTAVRAVT